MSDTARPKTAGDLLTANEINQDLPILGVAGETINGATLPVAVLSGSDIYTNSEKITQTSQNGSESLYGANWKAQTFLTDADTNRITSITLYLKKTLAPTGNFEIELFAVDGSNKPTGSALGNVTKTCASITTSYVLYNFEFSSPVAVDPSTTYAFVIKATSGDASNFVQYYRTNATVYADGGLTISADSGASWGSVSATTDLYFKLFGGFLLTDGRFYACEADNIDKLDFIGFVIDDVVAGDSTLFQKNGVVSGFTGLSIGYKYYIQDDKTIGTTIGTYESLVGVAISETELFILKQGKNRTYSGVNTLDATESTTITIGFRPSAILVYATKTTSGTSSYEDVSQGSWTAKGGNHCVYQKGSGQSGYSAKAYYTYAGNGVIDTITDSGFNFNHTDGNSEVYVVWTAIE